MWLKALGRPSREQLFSRHPLPHPRATQDHCGPLRHAPCSSPQLTFLLIVHSHSHKEQESSLCKACFSPSVGSEGEATSLGESPKIDQPGAKEVMNNFLALVTLS